MRNLSYIGLLDLCLRDLLEARMARILFLFSKIRIVGENIYESAALNMPAYLENSVVTTELENVSFHSNPKEGQYQIMERKIRSRTHA